MDREAWRASIHGVTRVGHNVTAIILLCVCVYVCVFVYHIFTCLSVDGHLGYFHVLAIVNSGAMEHWGACLFELHIFFQIHVQKWDCWIIR